MKEKSIVDELIKDLRKEKIQKDYSLLGLKFNPFPFAGLPRFILPPLDSEVMKKIVHFISSTWKKEEYSGLTIVGDYGMGKTHLMKYIQEVINDLTVQARKSKIDFSAATCFIDRPEDTPQRVIHKIIEDIGLDNIRKYIWKIIIDNVMADKNKFYNNYKPTYSLFGDSTNSWNELFEEPIKSNYLEFLERFRRHRGNFKKLQEDIRKIIEKEIVCDSALADRYLNLILFSEEKEADISWDILAGYVTKRDVKNKEIIFLNSIVEILEKVGLKHLYVFVDEFEDIGKLSSAKKTNYLLTLTTLINREARWSVVISLPRSVLEEEIKKEPPLYDRLTSTKINLKPLDEKKSKELLTRYLNLAREKEKDTHKPFSDTCIKEMIKISEGNYRSFLVLAYNSIEVAFRDQKSEIDVDAVNKAKELRGL
jgi:ABC-type dipeptide/oligopeptide/nickel transport system ATPase component